MIETLWIIQMSELIHVYLCSQTHLTQKFQLLEKHLYWDDEDWSFKEMKNNDIVVLSRSCACPSGYTGATCEVMEDKCLSNPCQHGGECETTTFGYVCNCEYPYIGTHCEVDTDLCFPNPCLHAGICSYDSREASGFKCTCAPGFIGRCFTTQLN